MKAPLFLAGALCAVATIGALCACGLVFDVDALGRGGAGDGDAALPQDLDAGVEAGVDAAAACPSLHGPAMIDAEGQCIDSTEVTVADYQPFNAMEGSLLPLPDPCDWVTTLEPMDFADQLAKPNAPVVNVHWCHAFHYCKWAGKRLCGRIGGGAVAPGDAGVDPKTNAWLRVCTHGGQQAYSYGPVVAEAACPNKIADVKSRGACTGPYPGLFDMVGNAGEWIDGCTPNGTSRPRDECTAMGTERTRDEASCYDYDDLSRYAVSPFLGFRCCGL